MKDYEGPAFKKENDSLKRRKFNFSEQDYGSGKSTFEPAYKKKQAKNKTLKEKTAVDEQRLNSDKSEPALSLDHYEIPYLKKYHLNQAYKKINVANEIESAEQLENIQEQQSERSNYKPSITKQEDNNPEIFKATQLPKPYKGVTKGQDLSPRQLASRLRKSKESFLLFDK